MKDTPEARQKRRDEFIHLAEGSGLSQKKIANICEVEPPTISDILNKKEFPGRGTLKLLRRELELMGMGDSPLRERSSSLSPSEWEVRAVEARNKLEKLRNGMRRLLDESAGLVNSSGSLDAVEATGQAAKKLDKGWKSPRQNKATMPGTSTPETGRASAPASSPQPTPPDPKAK